MLYFILLQNQAMWLGLFAMGMAVLFSVIVGRLTDLIYGHVKISLIFLIIAILVFYYWFFLIDYGIIPPDHCKYYLIFGIIYNSFK